jgi:16S rRNA (guanine1516-N2)-methyltransferase
MRLNEGSAMDYLANLAEEACPDVVYLDPMFPVSGKSALVKKEMRLFHSLVGLDEDSDALLDLALQRARHRVVVKRPPKAPYLAERKPQLSVAGKAVRFDIYPLKAFAK